MWSSTIVLFGLVSCAVAVPHNFAGLEERALEASSRNSVIPTRGYTAEKAKYLVETAPGETRWVTEGQKFELLRVSCHKNRA